MPRVKRGTVRRAKRKKLLGLAKSDLFVCRDTALDDTVAANLALQCTLKVL